MCVQFPRIAIPTILSDYRPYGFEHLMMNDTTPSLPSHRIASHATQHTSHKVDDLLYQRFQAEQKQHNAAKSHKNANMHDIYKADLTHHLHPSPTHTTTRTRPPHNHTNTQTRRHHSHHSQRASLSHSLSSPSSSLSPSSPSSLASPSSSPRCRGPPAASTCITQHARQQLSAYLTDRMPASTAPPSTHELDAILTLTGNTAHHAVQYLQHIHKLHTCDHTHANTHTPLTSVHAVLDALTHYIHVRDALRVYILHSSLFHHTALSLLINTHMIDTLLCDTCTYDDCMQYVRELNDEQRTFASVRELCAAIVQKREMQEKKVTQT